MKINIKTAAKNCHIAVYIESNGHTLLELRDTDNGSVNLLPGLTYKFEWHVWAINNATATIEADIDPANGGFNPLKIDKSYPDGGEDGNAFLFTLN